MSTVNVFGFTLYSASKQTRNAPCPNRGIHASAMKTKSMLHAIIGSCLTEAKDWGAFVGFPSVIRRSINSCRLDSHRFGSPIIKIAEKNGKCKYSNHIKLISTK